MHHYEVLPMKNVRMADLMLNSNFTILRNFFDNLKFFFVDNSFRNLQPSFAFKSPVEKHTSLSSVLTHLFAISNSFPLPALELLTITETLYDSTFLQCFQKRKTGCLSL